MVSPPCTRLDAAVHMEVHRHQGHPPFQFRQFIIGQGNYNILGLAMLHRRRFF